MGAPSLKYKGTSEAGKRLGLAVAGPATAAKQTVFSLVEQLGFDPVDGGGLDQSWRQQLGTPTYCHDMNAEQMRAGLAETTWDEIGKYREIRDQLKDFDAAMKTMGEYM